MCHLWGLWLLWRHRSEPDEVCSKRPGGSGVRVRVEVTRCLLAGDTGVLPGPFQFKGPGRKQSHRVQNLAGRADPELQEQGAPGTDNPQDTVPGPRRTDMSWGGYTVRWTDGLMMYRHGAWGTVCVAGYSFSPTPCPGGVRTKG